MADLKKSPKETKKSNCRMKLSAVEEKKEKIGGRGGRKV